MLCSVLHACLPVGRRLQAAGTSVSAPLAHLPPPSRGLLYCMEYLEDNLDDWLGEELQVVWVWLPAPCSTLCCKPVATILMAHSASASVCLPEGAWQQCTVWMKPRFCIGPCSCDVAELRR